MLNFIRYRKLGSAAGFYKSYFVKAINRNLSTSQKLFHKEKLAPVVQIVFVKANGEKKMASGKIGDSLLDVVMNNNLDFDGYGSCEGTLTCSTCHVILKREDYDRLSKRPSDEELDMLDLAEGICDTSRLGCQIKLTKDMDGLQVCLPSSIRDARND